LPASIFEKSKISLMMLSRASPERLMILTDSLCSALSGVFNSRLTKPNTPFNGVRISWLMVAKKSLLARVALSAASLARSSSVLIRCRSVKSSIKCSM